MRLVEPRIARESEPVMEKESFELYDTEYVLPGLLINQRLGFFRRPRGMTNSLGRGKSEADTNMTQCGQLACPLSFLVWEFSVHIGDSGHPSDHDNVVSRGVIRFERVARRALEAPLAPSNRGSGLFREMREPIVHGETFAAMLSWPYLSQDNQNPLMPGNWEIAHYAIYEPVPVRVVLRGELTFPR